MPLFRIETTESPETRELRAQHRQEHLDYLTENLTSILLTSGKLDDEGNDGYGSTYFIEADSLDAARSFIEAEPFYRYGIITDVDIKPARVAFLDRKSLI